MIGWDCARRHPHLSLFNNLYHFEECYNSIEMFVTRLNCVSHIVFGFIKNDFLKHKQPNVNVESRHFGVIMTPFLKVKWLRVTHFALRMLSSGTQRQLVGSTKCPWWKFTVRSRWAPGHLLLPNQFQKRLNCPLLIGQKKKFCGQSAKRSSLVTLMSPYTT